jgi:hypothetical protein
MAMYEIGEKGQNAKLHVCISKNTCKTLRHEPSARSPVNIDAPEAGGLRRAAGADAPEPTGAPMSVPDIRNSRFRRHWRRVSPLPPPLSSDGARLALFLPHKCSRRAAVIYFPPGSAEPGCGACLRLVYESQYEYTPEWVHFASAVARWYGPRETLL